MEMLTTKKRRVDPTLFHKVVYKFYFINRQFILFIFNLCLQYQSPHQKIMDTKGVDSQKSVNLPPILQHFVNEYS
jgi:hypothetical protein